MVDKIWYNMEELIGGSEERVLIETYWNVKVISRWLSRFCACVLIETYWNVKNVFAAASTWVLAVLIETYWNVKSVMTIFSTHSFSINRNILECKDGKSVVVRRI